MAAQKKSVRLAKSGTRDTITFRRNSIVYPDVYEHVGVADVGFGVGVFFRGDNNRAFVAHMGTTATHDNRTDGQLYSPSMSNEGIRRLTVRCRKSNGLFPSS